MKQNCINTFLSTCREKKEGILLIQAITVLSLSVTIFIFFNAILPCLATFPFVIPAALNCIFQGHMLTRYVANRGTLNIKREKLRKLYICICTHIHM